MRAKNRVNGAWVLLPLVCACFDVPLTGLCLGFDSSCSGSSGTTSSSFSWRAFVTGFPRERLEHTTVGGVDTYRGTLRVGDTVSVRLVVQIDSSPPSPVTAVKWEFADSAVAHIASDSGGVGRLTAVAPGKLPAFVANGTSYPAVYYCDTRNVCAMIGEIDILP